MKTMGPCKDCYYWLQTKPGSDMGTCQRYPPQIIGRQSAFPDTWRCYQCGEYAPDETEVEKK